MSHICSVTLTVIEAEFGSTVYSNYISASPTGYHCRSLLRVRMCPDVFHGISPLQSVNAPPGGQDGHVPHGAFVECGSCAQGRWDLPQNNITGVFKKQFSSMIFDYKNCMITCMCREVPRTINVLLQY